MFDWNKLPVYFDGQDLSPYLNVKNLDRGIGVSRNNKLLKAGNQKGKSFSSYTYDKKIISMDFSLVQDLTSKRRKLAGILNVDEPKVLIFGDEPDKYYLAIPDGNISLDETAQTGQGTIDWIVPSGIAYSTAEYTFTNVDASNNKQDYIIVDNLGTDRMELELQAEFTSDNGYFGIEGENNVRALFGDMTEVDKEPYERSEVLFNDHMYNDKDWALNSGKVPPVTPNPRQAGTVGYKVESLGEGYVYPLTYGEVVNDWSGPSLTKTVPTDSEGAYPINWTSDFRLDFNTVGSGTVGPVQVGHQSITFLDQNNNIIVAIVIEDNYGYAEKSDFAVYIRNKRVYDSRNTTSYYVTARPGDGNHFSIEKINGGILVRLVRNNDSKQFDYLYFDFPETNIELRKITWYAARYKAHNPINNNLLRAINLTKLNVQKWNDIPNKFMSGDTLVYKKEDRNIFCTVNNMNELRLRDVGSTPITAPPGRSIFYLVYSDFSDTPKVTLKGRARYT